MLAYKSLGQMVDEVCGMIGDNSDGRKTKVKRSLNMAYSDYAMHYRWPQLLKLSEEKVSLSAGSPGIYLPPDVEKLYFILPDEPNIVLQNGSLETLFDRYSDTRSSNGLTIHYAEAGEYARRVDFRTGGEQLSVGQANYTTTTTAYVRGHVNTLGGGDPDPGAATTEEAQETVTVSATEGVFTTLASELTYYDVISFSVESNDEGFYYLKGVTSGTIYASINPGSTTARYKRLRLFMAPAAAAVVTLGWKRQVSKLSNNAQVIELPIGYALINKAVAQQRVEQREFTAAQYHAQLADAEVESAFASCSQSDKIEQAIPQFRDWRGGYRGGSSIIVANP